MQCNYFESKLKFTARLHRTFINSSPCRMHGFCVCALMILILSKSLFAAEDYFHAATLKVSPNAALLTWHAAAPEQAARSYVLYGISAENLAQKTALTEGARYNQWHLLSGLSSQTAYAYQMVSVVAGKEIRSDVKTFRTADIDGRVALRSTGEKQVLDQAGAYYYLSEDVHSAGTGFEITAAQISLDLNGHTLVYGSGSAGRWHGVVIGAADAQVCNGRIVQSDKARNESEKQGGTYALGAFGAAKAAQVSGLDIFVPQREAYPICFLNQATHVQITHNRCVSNVTTFKSRHYPGNDMIRADCNEGRVSIAHNICLNGPHRGITVFGKAGDVVIRGNDVEHDQGYTNGYAINVAHDRSKAFDNRITSCGRGIHISAADIEVFGNYLNLTQHMVFDDRPQGSTTFRHYYTENHGIKLENCGEQVRVHHNTVISHQPQPRPRALRRFSDSVQGNISHNSGADLCYDGSHFAPPTPLNFHVGPNVMAEIYENTFIATTSYLQAHLPNGYYMPGEWAAALRIAKGEGESAPGKYSVYIHHNVFKSNDAFIRGCHTKQRIRLEKNKFELLDNPTQNHCAVRGEAEEAMRALLLSGENTFVGMRP